MGFQALTSRSAHWSLKTVLSMLCPGLSGALWWDNLLFTYHQPNQRQHINTLHVPGLTGSSWAVLIITVIILLYTDFYVNALESRSKKTHRIAAVNEETWLLFFFFFLWWWLSRLCFNDQIVTELISSDVHTPLNIFQRCLILRLKIFSNNKRSESL